MMHRHRWLLAAAVAAALGSLGCGGGTVKVNGVVTLDSKALPGATVTFVPVDVAKGKMATGTTDENGEFRLTTAKPNDGAFPGEYKVTVVYAEGAAPPPASGMKEAMEGYQKAQKERPKTPPKFKVPSKYADPNQTDIKQKVPPGGKVTIDLKSG
jgi:hypothetical protein